MKLTDPIFTDTEEARKWLEAQRWPNGPVCPHCGNSDPDKITGMSGKAHRPGLYQCNEPECREQFTVQVGSVMERSHIPLNKWLACMFLLASSKKGMSSRQIQRMLDLPYKTAWFLTHRIREAMKEDVKSSGPLGGAGKIVEADELYRGKRETPVERNRYLPPPTKRGRNGPAGKRVILGLVERGGKARMFHVHRATKQEIGDIIRTNVSRESRLHTDEANIYPELGREFAAHETVRHSAREYVRGDVHSNTVENVFSVFSRGMHGVYQHCGEAHLHRYLAEFDFRYNRRSALGFTDTERTEELVRATEGKRLMYRRPAPSKDA